MNEADFLVIAMAILFTAAVAAMDLRTMRIPNWLTLPAIVAGAMVIIIRCIYGYPIWLAATILTASLSLTYLLWLTGSWGGGDSKAVMAIFLLAGPVFASLSFMAVFTGSLGLLLIFREAYGRVTRPVHREIRIKHPMGHWILAAFLISVTACSLFSGGNA